MRKHYFLLLMIGLIAFTAALLLASCGDDIIKKGGAIEVTNDQNVFTYVIIVEGLELDQAWKDLQAGNGTYIERNSKETFTFDKDGFYTVLALPPAKIAIPPCFSQTVYVALGNTERVTVKE